jgi:hypothetical protein
MKIKLLPALILSVALVACGAEEEKNDDEKDSDEAKVVVETPEAETEEHIKSAIAAPTVSVDNPTEVVTVEEVIKPPVTEEVEVVEATTDVEPVVTTPASEEVVETPVVETVTATISSEPIVGIPSHKSWDELLRKYVSSSGKVNYAGIKTEKSKLTAYITLLKSNPPSSSWGKNDQLAYWINIYNAHTVNLILKNYGVSSITKINGGKPWDLKIVTSGTKTYTLNQVENEIIRPKFKEPRIHFAVNCAAKSCPKILNRAFTGATLNSQLEAAAKAFVNNTAKNTITGSKVTVSKIFEWYAKDFGNLITFLNKYSSTKISSSAKIAYMEYDWALNK